MQDGRQRHLEKRLQTNCHRMKYVFLGIFWYVEYISDFFVRCFYAPVLPQPVAILKNIMFQPPVINIECCIRSFLGFLCMYDPILISFRKDKTLLLKYKVQIFFYCFITLDHMTK